MRDYGIEETVEWVVLVGLVVLVNTVKTVKCILDFKILVIWPVPRIY